MNSGGTYKVKVYNGGSAICGPKAKASYSRTYIKSKYPHRHDRDMHTAICEPSEEEKRSENLKGPDQLITDIPAKIYQKLEVQLSVGQADCKLLASHVFPKITQEEIEYLTTRHRTNQARGVFKKMSERGITLGQLVEALKSIERQDVIETLIQAGYPKDLDTTENGDHDHHDDREPSIFDEEESSFINDEAKEDIPTQESICFEKNSVRILIEEPAAGAPKKVASAARPGSASTREGQSMASQPRLPPSFMKNIMTRVCFAQFPTSPEENYTDCCTIEDIKRH